MKRSRSRDAERSEVRASPWDDRRPKVQVLVAASEPLFGAGIATALQHRSLDVTLAATVADAAEVLDAVCPLWSVLVLDPPFPDAPSEHACAALIAPFERTIAVVLFRGKSRETVHAACRYGARGLLETSVDSGRLAAALDRVAGGEIVVDAALIPDVVDAHAVEEPAPQPALTENELAALRLVAEGQTSKEIAQKLRTTAGAVDHALERAAERLNATHRAHAVAQAIRFGLLV